LANSRRNVLKLKKDGLIMKKPSVVHSRARVQLRNEAKRKGRTLVRLYCILCCSKPSHRWTRAGALVPLQRDLFHMPCSRLSRARIVLFRLAIDGAIGQTTVGPLPRMVPYLYHWTMYSYHWTNFIEITLC
jgi:hypothetical protein